MLATLLLCLAADPAALDSVQGTWESAHGTQLAIDGDQIAVTGGDGLSGFTGRLVLTRTRLRIVDPGGVAERRWRLEGGRLRVGSVDYRRRLAEPGSPKDYRVTVPATL
jgi:hypothetical protein